MDNILRYCTYNKAGVFQSSYSVELFNVKMNPLAMARDCAKALDGYYTAVYEDQSEEFVEDFRWIEVEDLVEKESENVL